MPRPKTKTDDEVLDALGAVLLDKGPHDFTLQDVAAAVGLSTAALLQRYGTKQGLLVAFGRREADAAQSYFDGARPGTESPVGTLRRALLRMAADLADRRRFVNSMAMLLEDIRDDDLRAAAARQAEEVERHIRDLVERAVAQGEMRRCDSAERARLILAAWNGALILWALRSEGSLEEWLLDTVGPLLR